MTKWEVFGVQASAVVEADSEAEVMAMIRAGQVVWILDWEGVWIVPEEEEEE